MHAYTHIHTNTLIVLSNTHTHTHVLRIPHFAVNLMKTGFGKKIICSLVTEYAAKCPRLHFDLSRSRRKTHQRTLRLILPKKKVAHGSSSRVFEFNTVHVFTGRFCVPRNTNISSRANRTRQDNHYVRRRNGDVFRYPPRLRPH